MKILLIILILFVSINAYAQVSTQTITSGRDIITQHRIDHEKLYIGLTPSVSDAPDHQPLIKKMREEFQAMGFNDEGEFIKASEEYDKSLGLEKTEYWK